MTYLLLPPAEEIVGSACDNRRFLILHIHSVVSIDVGQVQPLSNVFE